MKKGRKKRFVVDPNFMAKGPPFQQIQPPST